MAVKRRLRYPARVAIYHLNANVISRARGQSIVAAAAYRSGGALHDERYGVMHNYTGKRPLGHAEIIAPDGCPPWVHDRQALWNRVDEAERRKDAQLARVIEIAVPVELTSAQSLSLVREYVVRTFVSQGMIADFCLRWDASGNPRASILLTLRRVTSAGFGAKERRWNGKAALFAWRSAWAAHANEHLALAGHPARIDHRTLEAQQIELTPARRYGIARAPDAAGSLPDYVVERHAEQRRIAHENGAAMFEDPTVALRALTLRSPTFTRHELEQFLKSRTAGADQFNAVLRRVSESPDLVALPDPTTTRFTSRDLIEASKSLAQRVLSMAGRGGHALTPHNHEMSLSRLPPSAALRRVFEYLVAEGAVKAWAADEATVKNTILEAGRIAWHADGLRATCAKPETLADVEAGWHQGRDVPTAASVLLIDGAELIGVKQLERVLAVVDRARAKAVLSADMARLRALGSNTPFWGVWQKIGIDIR